MNQKLFLAIALSMCAIHSDAQDLNFSVKWGKELEASSRSSLNDIVGHDPTGIYTVKQSDNFFSSDFEYTLEHYDTNFSLTNSFDPETVDDKQNTSIKKIIYIYNKLFIFYSTLDQKLKRIHFLLKN
jgi:hypothetical protein